jgi:hypothetical protein
MLVSEVERNKKDSAGAQIREVYARRPPEYAIYRTDERVAIHFADDREQEQAQRSALVRLNPIRGEINGLIDGWRQRESLRAKALCYDRRVGDALTLAFEQDVASAELLLTQIRTDIVDERMARARFLYLIYSFAAVALAIAIFAFMNSGSLYSFPAQSWNLWFGAGVGAVGAFFSIAIGIRGRTILTDMHKLNNGMDAVLRVVIGSIAAALLVCLVQSRAITFEIGAAKLDESGVVWLYVTIIAFIGGFSERLVPDLLGKIAAEPNNANTAASGAAPAAGPVAAGASAAAAPAIAAASEHAADHEREHDACLSEIDLAPGETTPDSELPAAVGGVATARVR